MKNNHRDSIAQCCTFAIKPLTPTIIIKCCCAATVTSSKCDNIPHRSSRYSSFAMCFREFQKTHFEHSCKILENEMMLQRRPHLLRISLNDLKSLQNGFKFNHFILLLREEINVCLADLFAIMFIILSIIALHTLAVVSEGMAIL